MTIVAKTFFVEMESIEKAISSYTATQDWSDPGLAAAAEISLRILVDIMGEAARRKWPGAKEAHDYFTTFTEPHPGNLDEDG